MGGVNDITIIAGIVIFFIAIGIITPFMNAEFGSDIDSHDGSKIITTSDVEGLNNKNNSKTTFYEYIGLNNLGASDEDNLSPFVIFFSVVKMFFWTFGSIPTMLDLILFVPLRILLVLIIARNIWIGGGG